MENVDQCPSGLMYNGFSVVFIQTFSINGYPKQLEKTHFIKSIDNSIDNQIFNLQGTLQESLIKRYNLQGFRIEIDIDEDEAPRLKGYVHVEASVFFDNTVSITYRLVIDSKKELKWDDKGFMASDRPFTTDNLIALAGIPLSTEHWSLEEGADQTEIKDEISRISISEVHLSVDGEWVEEPQKITGRGDAFVKLQDRYKRIFSNTSTSEEKFREYDFVFIDVWEDIGHAAGVDFSKMCEGEIIEHIERHHQSEMIGLFTLYPEEWPYRMASEMETICGANIAIDTDDLIYANQNMAVVFGTYGLRGKGSPTDWKTHLEERAFYHVSWPEYLLIVEIILAKKQAVNSALCHFIQNTIQVSNSRNTRRLIEQNALLTLEISNVLLKLDAIRFSRYASHKIMYERTYERLGLAKDLSQLENSMGQIDQALNNVTNIREIRQANLLNLILGVISVASLFGILLTPAEIPFFDSFFHNHELAEESGVGIMLFTFLLIIVSAFFGMYIMLRNYIYRKR